MIKPFILCFIDDDEIYQYTITRSVNIHQLAKKILKDKGEIISDETVSKMKEDTIAQLSKTEAVSTSKIIAGYILSIIFPFAGIYIGMSILNNKKILPNGQLFYIHDARDRKRGDQILTLSIMWIFIIVLIMIFFPLGISIISTKLGSIFNKPMYTILFIVIFFLVPIQLFILKVFLIPL